MNRMLRAGLPAFFSLWGSLAMAEDVVSRFLGIWVGEGQVRPNGFDDPEKTRCKVSGAEMTPMQISFAGRCATASGAGGFRLLLAQDAEGRLFAASARLGDGGEPYAFSGRIDEGRIELRQTGESGPAELSSVIFLTFPDENRIGMRMRTSNSASGEHADSLDLLFRRASDGN